MKEATGELNMTVIVVVAVGVLAAFFYTTIWPIIRNTYISSSKCSSAICYKETLSNGQVTCKYYDKNGNASEPFQCVWKG